MSAWRLLITAIVCLMIAACRRNTAPPTTPWFVDITASSGVSFEHDRSASGQFLLPEIMGGGGGFLDYDGDGLLDIYLVQSGRSTGNHLYRNRGNGQFVEVTAAAGVGDASYGMGCAAGDADNDGDVDLYVTNLGANVLYRNNGDGSFTDITASSGVASPSWSTSAAWCDIDHDGWLDLVVINYVAWTATPDFMNKSCSGKGGGRDYCSPQAYAAPAPDQVYHNNGDGTFSDVSSVSGIGTRPGTGLGVVCSDLNGDTLIDIYVSNDQMPSFAWINQGNGQFNEQAVGLGCAVDEMGKAQAGMGVAADDIDHDGDIDLWKVHLFRESHVLYINEAHYFDDATTRWGLSAATRRFTGFGTAIVDFDLDGLSDIMVANGRVQHVAEAITPTNVYAEPNQMLCQIAAGRFTDCSAAAGPALTQVDNSRGAAFGDLDNDGDVDVLVVNCGGPARLLRNDTPRRGHFLTIRALDRHGRDALGARLRCTAAQRVLTAEVRAAYSYCATNDPRVHLGLGAAERVESVEVTWPSGAFSRHGPFEVDAFVTIEEPDGVTNEQ